MDYNIYIHSIGDANVNGSFTMPWSNQERNNSPTSAWKKPEEISSAITNPLQTATGLVNQGMNVLAKALPEVAIAYVVVKGVEKAIQLADTCISTALPFYEAETGDFIKSRQYNDFKNAIGMIKNPFGTALNIAREHQTIRIENQRRAMKRELLGDSIVNTYTNRGV